MSINILFFAEISETNLTLKEFMNCIFEEFMEIIAFAKIFRPYVKLLNCN